MKHQNKKLALVDKEQATSKLNTIALSKIFSKLEDIEKEQNNIKHSLDVKLKGVNKKLDQLIPEENEPVWFSGLPID